LQGEQHGVNLGPEFLEVPQCFEPVGGRSHLIVFIRERFLEGLADVEIVIDD
jgi:hypothetical protein